MINFVVKIFILTFLFIPAAFSETTYPGDPPTPALRYILSDKDVQKKLKSFQKGCEKRLSSKACTCVTENVKMKLNGRDYDESDMDMLVSIASRKKLKAFKDIVKYPLTLDMIEVIESECVIDSKWRMDLGNE